jgi:hypothetical protein
MVADFSMAARLTLAVGSSPYFNHKIDVAKGAMTSQMSWTPPEKSGLVEAAITLLYP